MSRADEYAIGPIGAVLPLPPPASYDRTYFEDRARVLDAELNELRRSLHSVTAMAQETGLGVQDAPTTITGATPSVAGLSLLKTANGGATTVTNFLGGVVGQRILVIVDDANTTFDFSATNLKGNNAADLVAAAGDFLWCVYDGTNWYCIVELG